MSKRSAQIPEMDSNSNAVSIYGQDDAMEDFPVLKAFQQYMDSEQSKSRKRLIYLGVFFGVLMGIVIAVFLVMLFTISQRNQTLNDRLIDFAMKERETSHTPVVVQQPPVQQQQDSLALISLTSKIDDLQRKLVDSQRKTEDFEKAQQKVAAEAAAAAAAAVKKQTEVQQVQLTSPSPSPSAQELEIERLKLLLDAEKAKVAAEKEKLAAEKERQKKAEREAELEAYRRKHYPELYEQPKPIRKKSRRPVRIEEDEDEDVIEPEKESNVSLPKRAIQYFDEEDEDVDEPQPVPTSKPAVTKTPASTNAIAVSEVKSDKSPSPALQTPKPTVEKPVEAVAPEKKSLNPTPKLATDVTQKISEPPPAVKIPTESTPPVSTNKLTTTPSVKPAVKKVEPVVNTQVPSNPSSTSTNKVVTNSSAKLEVNNVTTSTPAKTVAKKIEPAGNTIRNEGQEVKKNTQPTEKTYTIPVEIKGSSAAWRIP